jgi:predicted RNA-binding protein YlxR (DUF448 family)
MSNQPVRSCAACRTRHPQGALVRVVRKSDGTVCVDQGAHRLSGRGAYLCPALSCLEMAERRNALGRTLHAAVPAECYHELRRVIVQHAHPSNDML